MKKKLLSIILCTLLLGGCSLQDHTQQFTRFDYLYPTASVLDFVKKTKRSLRQIQSLKDKVNNREYFYNIDIVYSREDVEQGILPGVYTYWVYYLDTRERIEEVKIPFTYQNDQYLDEHGNEIPELKNFKFYFQEHMVNTNIITSHKRSGGNPNLPNYSLKGLTNDDTEIKAYAQSTFFDLEAYDLEVKHILFRKDLGAPGEGVYDFRQSSDLEQYDDYAYLMVESFVAGR